ncbi:MAG: hypothetical protein FJX63_02405 [Alphaproteobacteria bacterium]|nr:hypothetical protein [Alphaproteobacteria bacterium]
MIISVGICPVALEFVKDVRGLKLGGDVSAEPWRHFGHEIFSRCLHAIHRPFASAVLNSLIEKSPPTLTAERDLVP